MATKLPTDTTTPAAALSYAHSGGQVDDEYLSELRGTRGRRTLRQMGDNATIAGLLSALHALFRTTEWHVDPAQAVEDVDTAAEQAGWAYRAITEMGDPTHPLGGSWDSFLYICATALENGWAYTDICRKLQDDGTIGIGQVTHVHPETLDRWEGEGRVVGLWQYPPNGGISRYIPLERAVLFVPEPWKGSPEGRSILRPAYSDWFYRERLVSFRAIFARNVDALTFSAGVKDGGIERGAEALLAEKRRVDQFGFLAAELQRAKDNTQRRYQRMYDERAKTESGQLVDELVRNFLEAEDIPGMDAEYKLTSQLLPTITLSDVNSLAKDWTTDANRVILIQAPLKAAVPTREQILAVLDKAKTATVTAYTETVTDAPLLERMPTPGRVVSTKTTAAVGLTEWKLSNGVRVLVKPTDFKADEVQFTAYSPGGNSLVPDADYMSAANIGSVVVASGVGSLSSTDLTKKLSGKAASVNVSVGQTGEGMSGGGSPKDLETMFQLIYLRFTAPRLDVPAWTARKAQMEAALANRSASPAAAFQDTVAVTMSQNKFRSRPPSLATLAEINPERSLAIYKDRFANAGDFTFVFVGSITLDSLKPFVEKYIASLPSTGRVENWKDVGDAPPSGVVDKTVLKGTEPMAATQITFTSPFKYTPKDRVELNGLTALGQMWLIDALREDLGGTYSPSLSGGGARLPREEAQISVFYQSSPDNVDKLSKRVFTVIDSLKRVGPNDVDLNKVKEQILRTRETSLKTNAYWVSGIRSRDESGEDVTGLLTAYDDLVKNLTAKDLQAAANRYFDLNHYWKVVLLPEKKAQ